MRARKFAFVVKGLLKGIDLSAMALSLALSCVSRMTVHAKAGLNLRTSLGIAVFSPFCAGRAADAALRSLSKP